VPGWRKWFNLYCLTLQAKSHLRFLRCGANVMQIGFAFFIVLAVLTLFMLVLVDVPGCKHRSCP
jgi:hypothetical protein